MSRLRFDYTWDKVNSGEPELRATSARLRILAGDESVTRYVDLQGKRVDDVLYVPALPIAEWIVEHWWRLVGAAPLADDFARKRDTRPLPYWSLANAVPGHVLPDLRFEPRDDDVLVAWRHLDCPESGLRFESAGKLALPREAVAAELRRFVDSTLERLHDFDLDRESLSRDWEATQAAEADPQARAFCRTAAALGYDPFDMPEDAKGVILDVAGRYSDAFAFEISSVAPVSSLREIAEKIDRALATAPSFDLRADVIESARKSAARLRKSRDKPWAFGYELARSVGLPSSESEVVGLSPIEAALGLDDLERLNGADFGTAEVHAASRTVGSAPRIALRPRRKASQRFAFARALCNLALDGERETSIVTKAPTWRQKVNKAFAAELLAPAAFLRRAVGKKVVDDSLIEELAGDLDVSELVVRHQIENHRIGIYAP